MSIDLSLSELIIIELSMEIELCKLMHLIKPDASFNVENRIKDVRNIIRKIEECL